MSDTSQGPGWWQASDGKWYPPEQAPGGAPAGGSGGGAAAPSLDVGAAISYGWSKFVEYIGVIILLVIIVFVVQGAFFGLSRILASGSGVTSLVLAQAISIVGWVVALVLQAGLIRAGLAITRGEKPEPGMLFETTHIASFIIASILVGLLFIVGFIACCVGMIVVAVFTLFYGYFIIDKGAEPVDSIGSSFRLVKENFGTIVLFAVVVFLLNLFTCGLAVGVTQISTAYAYKKLTGQEVAA